MGGSTRDEAKRTDREGVDRPDASHSTSIQAGGRRVSNTSESKSDRLSNIK